MVAERKPVGDTAGRDGAAPSPRGEVDDSSGLVGGEGDSRGDCCSSGDAMVAICRECSGRSRVEEGR